MERQQIVRAASNSPALPGVALPLQENLFSQVSGVQPQSPSATYSNSSGEGSRAGIQLPDVCRAKHQGNPQSEAANVRVAPMKNSMRERIYSAIAASEKPLKPELRGLTLKQLAYLFDKQLNQISGRVTELLAADRIERTSIVRDGCAVLRAKGTTK